MRLSSIVKKAEAAGQAGERLTDAQVKELQGVLLEILDDTVQICKKYHLTYILIGGTAIGALRHQGFIPWDDDIDIAMPHRDYNKFVKIVRSKYRDKYSVIHPKDADNCGRIIPKIRLNGTTYQTILEKDLKDPGIFIDIYLIENAFDNKALRQVQGFVDLAFGLLLSCRRIYAGRDFYSQYYRDFSKDAIEFRIRKVIGFFISFASLNTWARWTDFWYSICRDRNSEYVSIPSDDYHFFGEMYKRADLLNTKEVDFEGRKLTVSRNCEEYLTRRYGNYMEIPPEDKRERCRYLQYDMGIYGKGDRES